MSLNVVGSLDLNVDLIDKWNCEISHKSSKDYVKKPVFMVLRKLLGTFALRNADLVVSRTLEHDEPDVWHD